MWMCVYELEKNEAADELCPFLLFVFIWLIADNKQREIGWILVWCSGRPDGSTRWCDELLHKQHKLAPKVQLSLANTPIKSYFI